MEKNVELKKTSPYLLVRHGAEIDEAFKKAVREALLKHKQAGNPIAIGRDGKVIIIQPEDIVIE